MERKAKTKKAAGFTRAILAVNLIALIEKNYRALPNITQKQKAFAQDAKVTLSTVQRLVNEEVGANLETLEQLGLPFGISPYQLLVPNLNASNPQIVKGATKDEQRLYAAWRKAKLNGEPKPLAPAPGTPSKYPMPSIADDDRKKSRAS